jgi:hypothetical protein
MALKKTFVKENGISTSYHKISNVTIRSLDELSLHIQVTSYLNEEYREKEQEIETLFYTFDLVSEEEESMGARKLAYVKLKTLEEWADAEDC